MYTDITELLAWITELNATTKVNIEKISLEDSDFWSYDTEKGVICNKNNSFFQIAGIQKKLNDEVILEQPIIIQDEIGYLGIICKKENGTVYYLMQAKIEPGNINKVQISPTIQATKSNFTQKHGGKKPAYLEYFIHAERYNILVDQIQSEQSSRFLKKRNRNIIIQIDEDIEVLPNFRWMTLDQIKYLMSIDNLVNMDTRTVLSCLPLFEKKFSHDFLAVSEKSFTDHALFQSIMGAAEEFVLPQIFHYINNYKMFDETQLYQVPLYDLKHWHMEKQEYICEFPYSFKVVFCDIEIEGREVRRWTQPLFEATGIATFGLFTCVDQGVRKFLVHAKPEAGCFDKLELAPSVQWEYIRSEKNNSIDDLFEKHIKEKQGIIFDTLLSEEGGRFYCEQNRNLVIETSKAEIGDLPEGYFWSDFRTLNILTQINNCLNIQLRNLLAILRW